MINGAHVIIYSTDAEADRAFFRDVLRWPHVDVGHGWLIFRLPPAEVAVHPAAENDIHELYFLCDDVAATVGELRAHRVECSALEEQPWGRLTRIRLPGGGRVGLYQPRHDRAPRAA
ncbi:MAG TPA: extradiol dioxygenase [Polyangia bacterium]|jgi:catechol 2,3-dioxygenase-like lactoylglutathione lyase family enzyme